MPIPAIWTTQTNPNASGQYPGIKNSGGRWAAVDSTGNGDQIIYSDDGEVWNIATTPSSNNLKDIAGDGNGFWVAVGNNAEGTMYSTDNAETWQWSASGISSQLLSVLHDGSQFVACGSTFFDPIYTSPDGLVWTDHAFPINNASLEAIAFDGTTYIVVGSAGLTASSTDLSTWTTVTLPQSVNCESVTHTGTVGQFVLAGSSQTDRIWRSTNSGASWSAVDSGGSWSSISKGVSGELLVGGKNSSIYRYSDDGGLTWSGSITGNGSVNLSMSYFAGLWVSVSGSGVNPILAISTSGEFVPPETPDPKHPTQPLPVATLNPTKVVCRYHQAQAMSRLLVQFSESATLQGYIKALMSEANFLECELVAVLAERGIDTASGVQLDVLGEIVGQPRGVVDAGLLTFFGYAGAPTGVAGYDGGARYLGGNESPIGIRLLTDGEYRLFIRARIAKNHSKGNINSLVDMVTFLVNSTAFVVFDGPGPAEFTVGFDVGTLTANDKVFLTDSNLIPKPAGVAINLFEYPAAGAFAYAGAAGVIAGYDVGQYIGSF